MSGVTERAGQLVDELTAGGIKRVVTDVRHVRTPCVLVQPIPAYDFNVLGAGVAEITWTLVAMAGQPGDLRAARDLEQLVLLASTVLPIETARPAVYEIPGASDPMPAYLLTMTETIQTTRE